MNVSLLVKITKQLLNVMTALADRSNPYFLKRAVEHVSEFSSFVVILVLVHISLATARGATYDLASDYSTVSNPNGVWSYGAKTNFVGPLAVFPNESPSPAQNGVVVDNWNFGPFLPNIWHNGTANTATSDGLQGSYPPGTVCLFAGDSSHPYFYGVARFTSPQAGSYLVQTAVQSYLNGPSSGDYDFHVLDNGAEIFGRFLAGNTGTGFTNILNLSAGDTIDFVIGPGQDGNSSYSGAKILATLQSIFCTPHHATATAILYNTNFVVGATVTDAGCGYTNAPLVTITGGGGTGATATSTINANGNVVSVNITATGSGYTNAPQILIASPPFVPSVSIGISKINVTQHLMLGFNYILEASTDLKNWSATGPSFTATNENMVTEFDVSFTGRYFRIRQVP